MSQKHYIKKWEDAQTDLLRTIKIERPAKKQAPITDKKVAFQMVALRYVKYIGIYQQLTKCYDYMVHPQKRTLIVKCLECVTSRIVELREEMIRLELREYSYLGGLLIDLKLNPKSLEVNLSKFITHERVQLVRKRVNMLDYILASLSTGAREEAPEVVYTTLEAVLLIQKNERAFQARCRAKKMKRRKKGPTKINKEFVPLQEVSVRAVTLFQSMWRGLKARKQLGGVKRDAAMTLGMMAPQMPNLVDVTETKVLSLRFKEANDNMDSYMTQTIIATENMVETKGPGMEEDMKREIMQWILECRSVTGQFPTYPEEGQGGSNFLFAKKTMRELEDDMAELQEELEKGGKKKGGGSKKEKPKKKDGKKKKNPKELAEYEMKPSKVLDDVLALETQEYTRVWKGKDESHNRKQRHDRSILMDDVTTNVEGMIRTQVDELMRQELLRLALAIDKQKPPKKKKEKAKKEKKKKGKRGKKKMKDLTPGVPIEDLYKDLVLDGIIKKVPSVPLSSFIGEFNLMSEADGEDIKVQPDLGDVRIMAMDFGILPMSSELAHQNGPCTKSLMIVGPHGSGKKMLVNAIAYELGANFIDLSPENLEDKYEGKQAQQMLIHLVMKVGKAMEPSIIYIGNCDQMFTKKLPPDVESLKPGRLKKDLTKAMKFLGPQDRIMLVGTTKFPFKAAMAPMMKLYHRVIMIYPPSHASRYTLWKTLINEYKGIIPEEFDLTALSHVTRGFTAGDIKNAVCEVLTGKRVQKQSMYPIKTSEFLGRIGTFDPVFIPEMEEFEKWYNKTPLRKKSAKLEAMEKDGANTLGML